MRNAQINVLFERGAHSENSDFFKTYKTSRFARAVYNFMKSRCTHEIQAKQKYHFRRGEVLILA